MASNKSCDVMGIADGVGGWREMGVDPSKFSSNLMTQCKRIVEQDKNILSDAKNLNEKTPIQILSDGYNSLLESKDSNLIGSSTACLIVFNRENRKFYSANLGDSGFAVVRNNKIIHRSQEQCHYFNAPFQLSILPQQASEDTLITDKPENALSSSFELVEGDFIVLATDGLWDNLSEGLLLLKLAKIKV
jgi:protein phosphatase PTC7